MVKKNRNASMHWMKNNQEKRTNISNYYSKSKSVISVALNYFNGSQEIIIHHLISQIMQVGLIIILL